MADSINVNTQTLIDTAGKIRNINVNLDEKLKEINKEMNNLEATWKSDAATEIRANMNNLKPKFENYKEIVESYAKFLEKTASEYAGDERIIAGNAEQFRQA